MSLSLLPAIGGTEMGPFQLPENKYPKGILCGALRGPQAAVTQSAGFCSETYETTPGKSKKLRGNSCPNSDKAAETPLASQRITKQNALRDTLASRVSYVQIGFQR